MKTIDEITAFAHYLIGIAGDTYGHLAATREAGAPAPGDFSWENAKAVAGKLRTQSDALLVSMAELERLEGQGK